MLARLNETRGELNAAATHYAEAAALDPQDFVIRLDRSRILDKLDRTAEAEAEYRQAMALHTRQLWTPSGWARGMEVAWQFFYRSLRDQTLGAVATYAEGASGGR